MRKGGRRSAPAPWSRDNPCTCAGLHAAHATARVPRAPMGRRGAQTSGTGPGPRPHARLVSCPRRLCGDFTSPPTPGDQGTRGWGGAGREQSPPEQPAPGPPHAADASRASVSLAAKLETEHADTEAGGAEVPAPGQAGRPRYFAVVSPLCRAHPEQPPHARQVAGPEGRGRAAEDALWRQAGGPRPAAGVSLRAGKRPARHRAPGARGPRAQGTVSSPCSGFGTPGAATHTTSPRALQGRGRGAGRGRPPLWHSRPSTPPHPAPPAPDSRAWAGGPLEALLASRQEHKPSFLARNV